MQTVAFGTDWMVSPCRSCELICEDKTICAPICPDVTEFAKLLDGSSVDYLSAIEPDSDGYLFWFGGEQ